MRHGEAPQTLALVFICGIPNPEGRHPIPAQYGVPCAAPSGLGLTAAPETQGVALG